MKNLFLILFLPVLSVAGIGGFDFGYEDFGSVDSQNQITVEAEDTVMIIMAPTAGYGGKLAGRPMVIHPNRDTMIVEVIKDSTVASVAYFIPIADSARPNPWWRNDSASVYGTGFTSAGVIRNITAGENVVQKYWSSDQIDYYTGNWPRGWNRLVITTEDSLRDTISQYIAIPRKANP
jgi:hypothetical protein